MAGREGRELDSAELRRLLEQALEGDAGAGELSSAELASLRKLLEVYDLIRSGSRILKFVGMTAVGLAAVIAALIKLAEYWITATRAGGQ